jgi:hypothetical protein
MLIVDLATDCDTWLTLMNNLPAYSPKRPKRDKFKPPKMSMPANGEVGPVTIDGSNN